MGVLSYLKGILPVSRRSLYNILNEFEKLDLIEKLNDGSFLIKNFKYLNVESDKVKKFLENNY